MTEAVPVYLMEYDDPNETEVEKVDGEWIVTNHDELEKHPVIRGIPLDEAEGRDIITPESHLWEDEFEDIEMNDVFYV